MIDLYLRAGDQPTLDAALTAAGLIDAQANPVSALVCIDRIGTVSAVAYDAKQQPIVTALPGYHCNVRLLFDPSQDQLAALKAVMIAAPASPYRVWA